MFDVIVVGGGPAGLTAALYARRAGKETLVIEKNAFGGQITWSPMVENFPTVKSISGMELADRLMDQVIESGATLEIDEVLQIKKDGASFKVDTAFGGEFEAKAIIVATGARPRLLGLDREEELIGKGISFCALCDGEFYKGGKVAVVGGGNTALQEALYLAKICDEVYLIHRRDAFRADRALVDALKTQGNVRYFLSCKVAKLYGDEKLEKIGILDNDGNSKVVDVDCMFTAVGHEPENMLVKGIIELDESGYADAQEDGKTVCDGMFVAGDFRKKKVRQLATAMSDGANAAVLACEYIDTHW